MSKFIHPRSIKARIQTQISLTPESLFMNNKTGCDKLEGEKWKRGKERHTYLQIFERAIA